MRPGPARSFSFIIGDSHFLVAVTFNMSQRNQHILFFVLLIVIAFGAMTTLYVSTTAGLGFGNDSVAYVGAARNILDGNGYARTSGGGEIKPITHYPPLFSLVLAAGSALIHYDPLRIARGLIIILWGLSVFLGGWFVWCISRSMIVGLLFAFFFAANGSLLFVYAVIMSEPLYFVLTFATFLSFFAYLSKEKKTSEHKNHIISALRTPHLALFLAGIFSGLAYLTRYSGLAIIATIVPVLLLTSDQLEGPIPRGADLPCRGAALPIRLDFPQQPARTFRHQPRAQLPSHPS